MENRYAIRYALPSGIRWWPTGRESVPAERFSAAGEAPPTTSLAGSSVLWAKSKGSRMGTIEEATHVVWRQLPGARSLVGMYRRPHLDANSLELAPVDSYIRPILALHVVRGASSFTCDVYGRHPNRRFAAELYINSCLMLHLEDPPGERDGRQATVLDVCDVDESIF